MNADSLQVQNDNKSIKNNKMKGEQYAGSKKRRQLGSF